MKRLIRKADAISLDNKYIDGNAALAAISAKYPQMNANTVSADKNVERTALYGRFDDNGKYVAELYCFSVDGETKGVVVVAPIDIKSAQSYTVGSNYEVVSVSGKTQTAAKSSFLGGITLLNGERLTFNSNITTIGAATERVYTNKANENKTNDSSQNT